MMEYSKGHWTAARRRSKVGLTDPVTIMDQALSVLLGVIDLNIDEQELLIDLRKSHYDSEREVLRLMHRNILKNSSLQAIVDQRSASYLLTVQHQTSKQLLFRFYRRLEQRLFKKFLYYSINGKSVEFTKKSIIKLYNLNKQSTDSKKFMRDSLQLFHEIIKIVLKENQQLMNKLLQFIVDNNFVSSVDQFNLLRSRFNKEEKDSEMVVDSDDEYHERRLKPRMAEEQDGFAATQDIPLLRKHCSLKSTLRSGRRDVRRHLQSLMCKYSDAEARQSFVTQLSQNIIKEVIEEAANEQQEQHQQRSKKVQDSNFLKNIHHLRRASDGIERYSTLNDLTNTQSSLHQNESEKKRLTKQESFFVSTKSQFLQSKHQQPYRPNDRNESSSSKPSRKESYKQLHMKTNKISLTTMPQHKKYDHVQSRFKNSMGKLNQMRAQGKLLKTRNVKISLSNPSIPMSFYKRKQDTSVDCNSILNILKTKCEHPQGHINRLITVGSIDKRKDKESKLQPVSQHKKVSSSQQHLQLQWRKILAYDGLKSKPVLQGQDIKPTFQRNYQSCADVSNMLTHNDTKIFQQNASQKNSQTLQPSDISSILRQIIFSRDISKNMSQNEQVKPRRSLLSSKSNRKRLYSIWPFRQLLNVRDKKILQP